MQVYETLVSLNDDYSLRPVLAERWEFVEPNTCRFHLRPGVRFHDGRRLTADDVVWSWTAPFCPRPSPARSAPE